LLTSRQHDDQLVKDFGVKYAVDMIDKLTADGGVPGVHFCTLNLEKSVQRVLEGLSWIRHKTPDHNRLIVEQPDDLYNNGINMASSPPKDPKHMVTAHDAADSITHDLVNVVLSDHEEGAGEVNTAATWDEFPNGRFGDFKSPAFGDRDQWGGLSHMVQYSYTRGTKLWLICFPTRHLRHIGATQRLQPT
jgi:methylenetetrahydrofolate reductase (NADPH)